MKTCSKCKIDKPESEFRKAKAYRDGLNSWCKGCYNADNRDRRANPDKLKARAEARAEAGQLESRGLKKCAKCKAVEPKSEFYKDKRNKDDLYPQCKDCLKALRSKPEVKARVNAQMRKRRKTDPLFKMKGSMRGRTYLAFKRIGLNKPTNTETLLGTEWEEVKVYIENQFIEGMGWDNYGEWHIDHIIPLASAKNLDEIIPLCHYTNLQPLWAVDNIKKGCKTQGSLYHQTA